MFWNRKKRNQKSEQELAEIVVSRVVPTEPNISQPIKAFLAASERWEIWSGVRMGLDVIIVKDPDTSLRLEMFLDLSYTGNILSVCLNHSWLSSDEREAVVEEIRRVKMAGRSAIEGRERQRWTEAYKNLGEV